MLILEVQRQLPSGEFSLFGSDGVAVETDQNTEYRSSIKLTPGLRVFGEWHHDDATGRVTAKYLAPLTPSSRQREYLREAKRVLEEIDALVSDADELVLQRFEEVQEGAGRIESDPRF